MEICLSFWAVHYHLIMKISIHFTGERPHTCDQCQKTFTQASDLKKHRKSVHEGIRPYACQRCVKRFCYSNDLKKHEYTHTGERPWPCDLCERKFSQLVNLKNHKKLIHYGIRQAKDKPIYDCELCGKTFKRSSNLEIHKKKVHEDIQTPTNVLDMCDEQFTSMEELKTHSCVVHTLPAAIH